MIRLKKDLSRDIKYLIFGHKTREIVEYIDPGIVYSNRESTLTEVEDILNREIGGIEFTGLTAGNWGCERHHDNVISAISVPEEVGQFEFGYSIEPMPSGKSIQEILRENGFYVSERYGDMLSKEFFIVR